MRNKFPFILSITFFLLYKLLSYTTGNPIISLGIFVIPVLILIVHMTLRKKLVYKSWFISKINFLLEQKASEYFSDIPAQLLYEKLLEVVDTSTFELADTNADTYEILGVTAPNFWTWGENIYIILTETSNGNTSIKVTSITVFGSYSWYRNNANHKHFYETFEQSLTI